MLLGHGQLPGREREWVTEPCAQASIFSILKYGTDQSGSTIHMIAETEGDQLAFLAPSIRQAPTRLYRGIDPT